MSDQVDPTTTPRGVAPAVGHEHANVTGGWLRPAVFGAMDGLVSNFALIAGVAGGSGERSTVVLAGLAGLAAGAFSMAAGEYTSVASQAEHARAEIEVERVELVRNPEAEAAELAQTYVDRGLSPELAAEVARQLHRDPERALEAHTREELGVTLEDLPSARLAAISSFLAFAVGAVVPLVPYLLGAQTLLPAVVVSLLGLFAAGAVVTRITSRAWWYGGTRQLLLGAVAALLTYGFGTLVGAGLG
ncbi:MAG TPA: VIT1/CCC1 transporter family protein [Jiangellales bacterium]|nr:VIT1/CCC1 transporter family protein [Jiangellales bacterium]